MEDVRILGGLRMALYSTLFADDLARFRTLTAAQEESWRNEPRETLLLVRDALLWAKDHPDFDFDKLLPDLTHPNDVLHAYVVRLLGEIERLLNDKPVA